MASTLNSVLRNKLESVVTEARDVAEDGARAALDALAVGRPKADNHMTLEDRQLRNQLRAHARLAGDKQDQSDRIELHHLVSECAYEYWHRMLFARFLAENNLLIEPETGIAISLEECKSLTKDETVDLWVLASRFAQRMLPQIFRPDDPLLQVSYAKEHRLKLETLLDNINSAVFLASDALGWVYQFWQTKRKKQVNESVKSGKKIGADELPAVTQFFTEPYMVHFLIDNTIGAWWAGKVLAQKPDLALAATSEEELRKAIAVQGVSWEFLRFIKNENGTWSPAAGTFSGWPTKTADLKTIDPCCGSGHFIVALFYVLVALRMTEEGLSARDACDAVIRNNLHGLEIDERCTQIAAFALAVAAWTFPDTGGFRKLPEFHIACSGLAPSVKKEEWIALANTYVQTISLDSAPSLHLDPNKDPLWLAPFENGMAALYDLFEKAPVLGSLIDPTQIKGTMFQADFTQLTGLLQDALSKEQTSIGEDAHEMAVAAYGLSKAAELLARKYHFIITNVPYKNATELVNEVQDFFDHFYPEGKKALETVFVLRSLDLLHENGSATLVLPQNWMFLITYKPFRNRILTTTDISFLCKLGAGAFETISGEVVKAILFSIQKKSPEKNGMFFSIDVSKLGQSNERKQYLPISPIKFHSQADQLKNPDLRLVLDKTEGQTILKTYADSYVGLQNGDTPRYLFDFWELKSLKSSEDIWSLYHMPCEDTDYYSGRNGLLRWEKGKGSLSISEQARVQGSEAWGKPGILVRLTKPCPCTIFSGNLYDQSSAAIIPKNINDLPLLWSFFSSSDFRIELEKIDQKRNVTNATFVKVTFDPERWQHFTSEKHPNGLPEPYSDDPTQWIFHGHPEKSTSPLHVAVARVLGYRWPAELDKDMRLSAEARSLELRCDELFPFADKDGIICIPSVRGVEPAADRVRGLLASAYGAEWTPAKESELIKTTGTTALDLDTWLRTDFFEQHCKLFHHRPFLWHVWDGRTRDGFHAIVNYHKLAEANGKGRRLLDTLIYSYLGDWINRQKDEMKRNIGGADDRLVVAQELQKRLVAIAEGEPPFDIFVRWKPLSKQPIGWEPDINDGVRLNIRPFMVQDFPGGKKGAGILRWKPNINWNIDRGIEPHRDKAEYPWFWNGDGHTVDRLNDVHLTIEDKKKTRD
jgi:hypothetical protein